MPDRVSGRDQRTAIENGPVGLNRDPNHARTQPADQRTYDLAAVIVERCGKVQLIGWPDRQLFQQGLAQIPQHPYVRPARINMLWVHFRGDFGERGRDPGGYHDDFV